MKHIFSFFSMFKNNNNRKENPVNCVFKNSITPHSLNLKSEFATKNSWDRLNIECKTFQTAFFPPVF